MSAYDKPTGVLTYLPNSRQLKKHQSQAVKAAVSTIQYEGTNDIIVIFAESLEKAWDVMIPPIVALLNDTNCFFDIDVYAESEMTKFYIMDYQFLIVAADLDYTWQRLTGRTVSTALVDQSFIGTRADDFIRELLGETEGSLIPFDFKFIDSDYCDNDLELAFLMNLYGKRMFEPKQNLEEQLDDKKTGVAAIRSIPTESDEKPNSEFLFHLFASQ